MMAERFTVTATGHSSNYFPEYLAQELGLFEEVGLEVEARVPKPWDLVLDELESGQAHAALGGIWVPAMYQGRGRHHVVFGRLSNRCPFRLVSRHPEDAGAGLGALVGRTVLVPGDNGTSGFTFLHGVLEEADVDVGRIRFVRDLSAKMLTELFRGGMGDVLQVEPVTASKLVAEGAGHLVADLTGVGGEVPWSVYYTTAETWERERSLFDRFGTALERALRAVAGCEASVVRAVIRRHWPDDEAVVLRLVEDFRAAGMWAPSFEVASPGLNRWLAILVRAGLLETSQLGALIPTAGARLA